MKPIIIVLTVLAIASLVATRAFVPDFKWRNFLPDLTMLFVGLIAGLVIVEYYFKDIQRKNDLRWATPGIQKFLPIANHHLEKISLLLVETQQLQSTNDLDAITDTVFKSDQYRQISEEILKAKLPALDAELNKLKSTYQESIGVEYITKINELIPLLDNLQTLSNEIKQHRVERLLQKGITFAKIEKLVKQIHRYLAEFAGELSIDLQNVDP